MSENAESRKKGTRIGTLPGVLIILAAIVVLFLFVRPTVITPRHYMTNEAAAISTLRTIYKAQEGYRAHWGSYCAAFDALREAKAVNLKFAQGTATYSHILLPSKEDNARTVKGIATGGEKTGYVYEMVVWHALDRWSVSATPSEPGRTGKRSLYIDQSGVVRTEKCERANDKPADANSPALN
jgi:type II secretory pathway pseudopilin PulG